MANKIQSGKMLVSLLCSAIILLSGCGSPKNVCEGYASQQSLQGSGSFLPGEYRATAWGFAGKIVVEAQFSDTDLLWLRIEGIEESGKGARAIRRLCGDILELQSPNVDAISGATMTSNAIKKAAKKCFEQAEARNDEIFDSQDEVG